MVQFESHFCAGYSVEEVLLLKMAIVKIVQGRLDTSRWAVVSLVELTTVEYVSTAYASPLLDNGKSLKVFHSPYRERTAAYPITGR
jgi:hypothetical protein